MWACRKLSSSTPTPCCGRRPVAARDRAAPARAPPRLRRRRARPVRPRASTCRRRLRRRAVRAPARAAVAGARPLLVPDRGTREPRSGARDGCRRPGSSNGSTRTRRARHPSDFSASRRAPRSRSRPCGSTRSASRSSSTCRATPRPATCPAMPSSPSCTPPVFWGRGTNDDVIPEFLVAHTTRVAARARRAERPRLPGPHPQRLGAGARRRARLPRQAARGARRRVRTDRPTIAWLTRRACGIRYRGSRPCPECEEVR